MKHRLSHKNDTVSIPHYAPHVTLTALDYILPVTHQQRMQQAEQRIRDFLAKTQPDSLCETFYDRCAVREDELIIAALREQTPEHNDANASIVRKHRAELDRLDLSIVQAAAAIERYEAEIAGLQQLYDKFNQGG